MSRKFVSGVAARGAFRQINGRWEKVDDLDPGSTWGWSQKSNGLWCEPKNTLTEARECAGGME